MSSPSTLSRQHRNSRSSTPSTFSHGSPSNQLTPRSKVRILLEAIDDDSEADTEAFRNGKLKTGKDEERRGLGVTLGNAQPKSGSNDSSEDSEDEEDVVPTVPKGRLAARMLARKDKAVEEKRHLGTEENAYERVKKQLLKGTKDINQVATKLSGGSAGARSEDDEQIIDLARPRRKRFNNARGSLQETPAAELSQPRPSTPGLSVSTSLGSSGQEKGADAAASGGSDSDLPANPNESSRFLALVARKREERKAKEEAEARKKAERKAHWDTQSKHASRPRGSSPILESETDSDDNAGGRRLTQQARPTRKASKKALEEMNRETQRMSRNMQLAHQARTKKKISKESFLAKYNFRPGTEATVDTSKAASSSATASSAAVSEAEGLQHHQTPPTSPIVHDSFEPETDKEQKVLTLACGESNDQMAMDMDEELPTMEDVMTQPVHRLDKGKGKAAEPRIIDRPQAPIKGKKLMFTQPLVKIHPPKHMRTYERTADSDSELEIVADPTPRPRKADIFDHVRVEKATEVRPLLTLRALANLKSPGKQSNKTRASMTPTEMQNDLRRRARQQAGRERAEKLQQLRDRGIIVQTAEERQKDQAEVEDIMEKAKREADEIKKKEKDAAKKEGTANGKTDGLIDSSDEDEEYVDDVEDEEVELSGSEEELEEEEGHGDEDEDSHNDEEESIINQDKENMDALIDREASEGSEEDGHGDDEDSEEDEQHAPVLQSRRKSKINRVVSDDDGDDDMEANTTNQDSALSRSAQKPVNPGLPMTFGLPLGLTQAFAATMAESQTQAGDTVMKDSLDPEQDSLAFLRGMPQPEFPTFDDTLVGDPDDVVRDSQLSQSRSRVEESQEASTMPEIVLHYSQSQMGDDAVLDAQHLPTATQYSDIPDPTQDAGFAVCSPPAGQFLEGPSSTVDTVLLSRADTQLSPVVKKKGRLRRRIEAVPIHSDDEENLVEPETGEDFVISSNVFDVMRKAARKPATVVEEFNKKKSEAKTMVEEQAEESEDEYAGLGGASDEDSGAEEDEEVQNMIDESDVKVDERKLAAFYA